MDTTSQHAGASATGVGSRVAIAVVILVTGVAVAWKLATRRQGPVLRAAALVGTTSPRDRAVRAGHRLAISALEREGLGGIEVVYFDPGGSVQTATTHLQALAGQQIDYLVDVGDHDLASGCGPALRESELIVLSACGDPRLLGLGERFLRVARWDWEAARGLAAWARSLGCKRPAVLVPEGAAGQAARTSFLRAWGDLGESHVMEVRDGSAQAAWAARRLAELEPDGVVLLVPSRDAVPVLVELDRSGPSIRRFLTLDSDLGPGVMRAGLKDVLPRLHLATAEEPAAPTRDLLLAAWAREEGNEPPPEAFFAAHDAVQLLARAHHAAKGDKSRTLLELRGSRFLGATGRIEFMGDGERPTLELRRSTYTPDGTVVPWTFDGSGM